MITLADLIPVVAQANPKARAPELVKAAMRLRPALELAALVDQANEQKTVFRGTVLKVARIKTQSHDGDPLPGKARITYAPEKPRVDRNGNAVTEEAIETDWLYPGSTAEWIGRVAAANVGETVTMWKVNAEDPSGEVSQGYRRIVFIEGPNPPVEQRNGARAEQPAPQRRPEPQPEPAPQRRPEPEPEPKGSSAAQRFNTLWNELSGDQRAAYTDWTKTQGRKLRPTDPAQLAEAVEMLTGLLDGVRPPGTGPAAHPYDPDAPASAMFGDACMDVFTDLDAYIDSLEPESVATAAFEAWTTWQEEHGVMALLPSMRAADYEKAALAAGEIRNRFRPIRSDESPF